MKIVIVEDEAPIREGMEGILRKLDPSYELVGKASNGLEGLEVIRRTKPDVIIMDIQMPDMDGLTMLEKLRGEGVDATVLILSAYSDFDYARKAMELGVVNYLLKPVRLSRLKKVLSRIEEDAREEERSRMLLAPENIIRSAMTGILENTAETKKILEDRYGISEKEPLAVLQVWLGDWYEAYGEIVCRILEELLAHAEGFSGILITYPERVSLSLVLHHMDQEKDWEEYFRRSVLPMLETNTENKALCAWLECGSIFSLKTADKLTRALLEWSLTLGTTELISERVVKKLQICPMNYQPELNVRLRQIVIKGSAEEYAAFFREFHAFCCDRPHDPRQIKENMLTCIWTILNTAKECVPQAQQGSRNKELLEAAMAAFTWEQFGAVLRSLFYSFNGKGDHGQNHTLLIQRARRMIEEYYSQQITMEEAARTLGVSPEYLSRQYKKETGRSFTEDLRRMKVEKVKTLLVGTGLNLTRIAALTGFSDPKYMSKVFREEVGVLPAEYRRLHL